MNRPTEKVVFDCNIFLQYLLAPEGPAGRCVQLALDRLVELQLSLSILVELRELPDKPIGRKVGLTPEIIERFIGTLLLVSGYTEIVPEQYHHPIDPDDSCYVNLAIATDAKLVVSRDRHLLNLNNPGMPWSAEFRARFPNVRMVVPEEFLVGRQ